MADTESFYEQPLWKRLYAFLLAPLLVAAAAVGVFTAVSLLTNETTHPDELVAAIKGGGEHRRWQSAFALTKYLQPSVQEAGTVLERESDAEYQAKLLQVRPLLPELLDVWNDPKRGTDEVRRYLALVFGYLGDSRSIEALSGVMGVEDQELVLNSLVALGMIGDRKATPAALEGSRRDETGLRSTAAYVLGVLGGPAATDRLEVLVTDTSPSVRWNAAFGLARVGNAAGEEVILEILERGPIYQGESADPARQREQFLNAVRSAGMLRSARTMDKLRTIAQTDENLKARDMAKKLVAAKDSSL